VLGTSETPRRDLLLRAAWPLILFGALTTPMLVFRIAGTTVSDLAFGLGTALVLLSGARPRLRPQPLVILASVLAVIGAPLASLSAVSFSDSLLVGVRLIYVWTIWQYSIRVSADVPERASQLSLFYTIGAALSGFAAIAQTALHVTIPNSQIAFGRYSGLATHVNGQGGALAAGAAIAFALFVMGYRRLLTMVSLILCVVGLVIAGSVTGMIGAAAGILVTLLIRRVRVKIFIWLAIASAVIYFAAANVQKFIPGVASPLDRLKQTTGTTGEYGNVGTLALRILTDKFAWSKIKESPFFGVGLDIPSGGTFDGVTQTHNMLLLAWYQGGALMLIAIVLVLVEAGRRAVLRENRTTISGVVAIASVVAVFTCAMTGPLLFDRFFWLPVALALALPMRAAPLPLRHVALERVRGSA
jgi:O-antigen ligase